MAEPFIKLYKKMLKWEWYDDVNTFRLFLHCLLRANWESGSWHGIHYEPGQFITSLQTLSTETHLTVKQVRVALDHLKATNEVADLRQGNYRIITVVKWNEYQCKGKPNGKLGADQGQTEGKLGATDKEYKEYKEREEEKEINNNYLTDSSSVSKTDMQNIIDMWNELGAFGIPPVKGISEGSKRNTQLKARLKQFGISDFRNAINEIRQSSFLKGQNKTGWMITFDWFIKPSNFTKVLEGNYSDKKEIRNVRSIQGGVEQYSSGNEERDREIDDIIRRIEDGDEGESLF